MSKPQTTRPTKKPAPAPVRPQPTTAKKPAPAAVKPQSNAKSTVSTARAPAKKPAPPAVKPPTSAPRTSAPKTTTKPSAAGGQAKAAQQLSTAQAGGGGEKSDNWISRTVQAQVQKVGDYAGNYIGGWGEKVNKVGEGVGSSITNQTRGWGQGVAGYGNNIKDQVGVGGPRVSTAGNPLGMAGMGSAQGQITGSKPAMGQTSTPAKGSFF